MTLSDDDQITAKIIKDLEKRLSNLEEKSRSESQPNVLISETETVGADDRVDDVTEHTLASATWGNPGWKTSTWGAFSRV